MNETANTTPISISLEFTPNPNTLKFLVSRTLLDKGAANFADAVKAENSPLAKKLFNVQGVQGVMIGTNFVTITKSPTGDWDIVADEVPKTIESHLASGEMILNADYNSSAPSSSSDSEVERKVREVLDNEIRPAVAMDGGDIEFGKYENGIVYLHLQGSCSSCPSAVATLKMGVEARLKEVVPEIQEVVQI